MDRASVTSEELYKALNDAAPPFMELEQTFYKMCQLAAKDNKEAKKMKVMLERNQPALGT